MGAWGQGQVLPILPKVQQGPHQSRGVLKHLEDEQAYVHQVWAGRGWRSHNSLVTRSLSLSRDIEVGFQPWLLWLSGLRATSLILSFLTWSP